MYPLLLFAEAELLTHTKHTHTHISTVIWSAGRNTKPDIHKINKGGTGEKQYGKVQDVKEKDRT